MIFCYNLLMFILAQFFGLLCLIAFIINTQSNDKKTILFWRTISNAFAAIQYILLGSWSGLLINIVGSARNISYAKCNKKTCPRKMVLIYTFLILLSGVVSIIIFHDGPESLLITAQSIILTVFIGQKNMMRYRMSQIFALPLVIVYNFSVGAYVGVIVCIVQIISLAVGVKRFDEKAVKRDLKKHKRALKKLKSRL